MTAAAAYGPLNVLVVDDQRAFGESLAVVIDTQDDLACVGVASSGAEAVAEVVRHRPQIVLMDVGLPGVDGIAATEQIVAASPGVRVIILTGRPDATVLARAATAGAAAFLSKAASIDDILDAVRQPVSRRLAVDPSALEGVVSGGCPPGAMELTARELDVLRLLADGRQPKQIAPILGIALPTCRAYIKTLLQKLGAHSALEAVVVAHRHGLIRLADPLG
jgi:DNA-binding NarL/FixJ family response regulator